jgi:hypothetical protein
MRNIDELLATLFAVARHELLANDPDWPNTTPSENGLTLIVLERLGLACLTSDEDGKLTWRATDSLVRIAKHNGFCLPRGGALASR